MDGEVVGALSYSWGPDPGCGVYYGTGNCSPGLKISWILGWVLVVEGLARIPPNAGVKACGFKDLILYNDPSVGNVHNI